MNDIDRKTTVNITDKDARGETRTVRFILPEYYLAYAVENEDIPSLELLTTLK